MESKDLSSKPVIMNVLRSLVLLTTMPLLCSGAFPAFSLKNVCDDQLHAPTNITHAGDGSGRLFICDQPGKIYIFKQGMLQPTPFLDLSSTGLNRVINSSTSYSERGLLGMAFHPDFAHPFAPGYRRFYVNYTAVSGAQTDNPSTPQNCVTIIAEYLVSNDDPNVADPTSERILLTYGQPQSNHNGGQLEFGPDGYLYISAGDGGSANDNAEGHTGGSGSNSAGRISGTLGNAQDKTKLLGKILRIDPLGNNGPGGQYGIPADNPFVSGVNGERKEIYAFGLRNPWRFSFDHPQGGPTRLFCAEVGQIDVEEVNLITSGGNYGWRMKEGSVDFDNTAPSGGGDLVNPIAEYAHPGATLPGTESMPKYGTSITGGYVYRGSAIPGLQGKYLFGDYAANGIGGGGGILLGLEETTPGVFTLSQVNALNSLPAAARIYTFGVDESGEMYVATKTTAGVLALDGGNPAGTIYKIVPVAESQVNLSANRDNTIYETVIEPNSPPKNYSNGKGIYLFAGKTGDMANYKVRRALLRFDLSAIPNGAVLTSASVRLNLDKQVSQGGAMTLHRLTADWGEGNSNAGTPGGAGTTPQTGDATWMHRFHDTTAWEAQGGDFVSTASSTYVIGSNLSDPYPTWTGPGLLEDVLSWMETPSSNFGWILIGDETMEASAQRFASRENATTGNRPRLTVSYAVLPEASHFDQWLAAYFPAEPMGFFLDYEGDLDHDGISNLHEYAYGLNPVIADEDSGFSQVQEVGQDDSLIYTLTFRRDSAATDLTYQLQTSPNLVTWTTIASSLAGTSTLGSNGGFVVSEEVVSGTVRLVTVRETLTAPVKQRRFVRLHVVRSF